MADALRDLRMQQLGAEGNLLPGHVRLDARGDGDSPLGIEARHVVRQGAVDQLRLRHSGPEQGGEDQHRQERPKPQDRIRSRKRSL
jgi:hypothetical protein